MDAATVYRIHMETNGRQRTVGSMRVTVAGEQVCIDSDRDGGGVATHDAMTSRDGGGTFIAINHDLKTWFPLEHPPLAIPVEPCGLGPHSKVRKVSWTLESPASDRYIGKLSYTVRDVMLGERIDVTCRATLEIRTAGEPSRAAWPSKSFLTTTYAEIDEQIGRDLAKIAEFPVRLSLTSTRQVRGGPPFATETVYTVEDVREVLDGPMPSCEVPAGYRQQAPIIGAPGR